jgi:hypothetical protein
MLVIGCVFSIRGEELIESHSFRSLKVNVNVCLFSLMMKQLRNFGFLHYEEIRFNISSKFDDLIIIVSNLEDFQNLLMKNKTAIQSCHLQNILLVPFLLFF